MHVNANETKSEVSLIERFIAKEKRFTLSEIAKLLGVTAETVMNWHERGVGNVRLRLMKLGGGWICFYGELSEFLEATQETGPTESMEG
jgi:transcriptional regulator with XRE-family HTH domain